MSYWDQRATDAGGRVATFDGIDWHAGTDQMVGLVLPWLPAAGTVADLGCGVGRMASPVGSIRPDLSVVGVDASPVMLAQTEPSPANVTYVQADVTALPFDRVDGAWSTLVVQHLNPGQVAAMFAEVRRTLTSGGRFVCQWVPGDWHAPNDHKHSLVDLDDLAMPLGLVDVFDGVHPEWQWAVWQA